MNFVIKASEMFVPVFMTFAFVLSIASGLINKRG